MKKMELRDVKPGDYIKRKKDAKTVYRKGAFDRASKKYGLSDAEDVNREIFLGGSTVVFVGFTY